VIGSGYAIGTNRMLMTALERIDLSDYELNADVAVLVMGQDQASYAMSVLAQLRDAKIVAVPYLDTDKKFKNQIEFADKIKSKFSIIIGEDEVKNRMLAVKDMTTGDQIQMTIDDAIRKIKMA
jgi:histidyl-tRNA synthetase